MKFGMKVQKEVDAKVLELHAKVADSESYTLKDADGTVLKEHNSYVPDFFPGKHYGDYIELNIDIDTGQILNWVKPSPAQLKAFVDWEEE